MGKTHRADSNLTETLRTRCDVGVHRNRTVARAWIKSRLLPPAVFFLFVAFLFGEELINRHEYRMMSETSDKQRWRKGN